jgi:hypothetical protein
MILTALLLLLIGLCMLLFKWQTTMMLRRLFANTNLFLCTKVVAKL